MKNDDIDSEAILPEDPRFRKGLGARTEAEYKRFIYTKCEHCGHLGDHHNVDTPMVCYMPQSDLKTRCLCPGYAPKQNPWKEILKTVKRGKR